MLFSMYFILFAHHPISGTLYPISRTYSTKIKENIETFKCLDIIESDEYVEISKNWRDER